MIETIFHGHSFIEVVYEGESILIDPFIEGNTQCDVTIEECIDKNLIAILLTHGHADHIGNTVEIAKATGCIVICSFEVGNRLEQQGISNISKQHIGGSVQYEGYRVKFTPALHGGDIDGSEITGVAAGILLYRGGKTIYHAGDTGLTMEFELLGRYETIDCAFLPIGDRFTMGPEDAVHATQMIRPGYVIPIHYNTWDFIKVDPMEFAREVLLGKYAVPKVLNPGQLLVLE